MIVIMAGLGRKRREKRGRKRREGRQLSGERKGRGANEGPQEEEAWLDKGVKAT